VKKKVRVLLCDDQSLVRKNVRKAIGACAGFEVVGEAEAGNVGVQMATDLDVDLVVMDVSMPGMDGIEATRQIVANARPGGEDPHLFLGNRFQQIVPQALFLPGPPVICSRMRVPGEMSQWR
jgi:DNA-binding NarL/FixJ family response regulator